MVCTVVVDGETTEGELVNDDNTEAGVITVIDAAEVVVGEVDTG